MKDEDSRKDLRNRIADNYFVEAGAGSGKTSILVDRMVSMVKEGKPVSSICAITFTKAAANNFYRRFQAALAKESKNKYCAEALKDINLCFMGTIDSFCSLILSEHPMEAGVPANAKLISGEEALDLYMKYYGALRKGDFALDGKMICQLNEYKGLLELVDVFSKLHKNPETVFAKGISIFMNNRNVDFDIPTLKSLNLEDYVAEYKAKLLDALKILQSQPAFRYSGKGRESATSDNNLTWNSLPRIISRLDTAWTNKDFLRILDTIKGLKELRIIPNETIEKSADLSAVYEEKLKEFFKKGKGKWLVFACSEGDYSISELSEFQYKITMNFLNGCVGLLENDLKINGYLTFFDHLYYLREMLAKDIKDNEGKLIKYISDRHSYYLLDEFQDTNPLQAEIFFYLSASKLDENWRNCKLRPGALFVVGDPKQSIYRFRGGDVDAYIDIKTLFKEESQAEDEKYKGDIRYLTKNFRSVDELRLYFNNVCPSLFLSGDSAITFSAIPDPAEDMEETEGNSKKNRKIIKNAEEFTGIYTYNDCYKKQDSEDNEDGETKQILKIIKTLVGNKNYKVTPDKGADERYIQFKDFMIITDVKDNLKPIVEELHANDIPIHVEGSVNFADNEAFVEVMNLYSAIADVNDSISLYSVLKGKIYALSDADLYAYKTAGKYISTTKTVELSSLTTEASLKVGMALNEIYDMRRAGRRLSPSGLFARIIDSTELFRVVEVFELELLYYALELLRDGEISGTITSHKEAVAFLKKLVGEEKEIERCLSLKKDDDCVHLANLHKVKGLEAPFVILAGGSIPAEDRKPKYRFVHSNNENRGYIFRESGDNFSVAFSTKEYETEKAAEIRAANQEENRLLYVAATRPRNALIISTGKGSKGSNKKTLPKWEKLYSEQDTKDFFNDTDFKDNLNFPETTTLGRTIDKLYEATEHSILDYDEENQNGKKERSVEIPTYKIARPSSCDSKVESNNSEYDSTYDETGDENFADNLTDIQEPKVVVLNISVDEKDSEVVHAHYKEWGTMVHRLMEEIVSSKEKVLISEPSVDSKVKEIVKDYWKPQMGDYESDTKNPYVEILTKIANSIKSLDDTSEAGKCYRAMLNAQEKSCEVPFYYKDGSVVWNGIIDALYVDQKGSWHIIDYKTNAKKTEKELKSEYKNQMSAYIKACGEMLGVKNIDATLFYINV